MGNNQQTSALKNKSMELVVVIRKYSLQQQQFYQYLKGLAVAVSDYFIILCPCDVGTTVAGVIIVVVTNLAAGKKRRYQQQFPRNSCQLSQPLVASFWSSCCPLPLEFLLLLHSRQIFVVILLLLIGSVPVLLQQYRYYQTI